MALNTFFRHVKFEHQTKVDTHRNNYRIIKGFLFVPDYKSYDWANLECRGYHECSVKKVKEKLSIDETIILIRSGCRGKPEDFIEEMIEKVLKVKKKEEKEHAIAAN